MIADLEQPLILVPIHELVRTMSEQYDLWMAADSEAKEARARLDETLAEFVRRQKAGAVQPSLLGTKLS